MTSKNTTPPALPAPEEFDFDTWLNTATLAHTTVRVCLDQRSACDLREAESAAVSGPRRFAGTTTTTPSADIEALRARVEASTRTITVRALTNPEIDTLNVEYPTPQSDDPDRAAKMAARLCAMFAAQTVSPKLDMTQARALYDAVGEAVFAQAYVRAQQLMGKDFAPDFPTSPEPSTPSQGLSDS